MAFYHQVSFYDYSTLLCRFFLSRFKSVDAWYWLAMYEIIDLINFARKVALIPMLGNNEALIGKIHKKTLILSIFFYGIIEEFERFCVGKTEKILYLWHLHRKIRTFHFRWN